PAIQHRHWNTPVPALGCCASTFQLPPVCFRFSTDCLPFTCCAVNCTLLVRLPISSGRCQRKGQSRHPCLSPNEHLEGITCIAVRLAMPISVSNAPWPCTTPDSMVA